MSKVVEVGPELAPDRFVQAELARSAATADAGACRPSRVRAGSPGISRRSRKVTTTTPSNNRNREKDPAHDIAAGLGS